MPSLNEGSFLLMPTSMPHSSIEKNLDYIETLDRRLSAIPEVETAVGKWGRVNSALDPAPVQMFENTINYLPEYILDENGHRQTFKVNRQEEYLLNTDAIKEKYRNEILIPAGDSSRSTSSISPAVNDSGSVSSMSSASNDSGSVSLMSPAGGAGVDKRDLC